MFTYLILSSVACFSQSNTLELFDPSQAPPIKKSQGYLLLNLDVGGTAPSIDILKLATNKRTIDNRNKDIGISAIRRAMTLNLQNKPDGFYVIPLPSGLYQITSIQAPYYNLPFRLDTEFNRIWRFYIEPGAVNYAGKLFIDSERGKSSIDVDLINRIATDEQLIKEQLGWLLSQHPLKSGAGLRDDFYEELTSEE